MKIIITDFETTGLNSDIHEIIEIGAVRFDSITMQIEGTLSVKVQPEHIELAEGNALLVNGYTEEDWKDAATLDQAIGMYDKLADGAHFAAFNITFDALFLNKALLKLKRSINLARPSIDVLTIALAKIPSCPVYHLKDVCTILGIAPEDQKHEALKGAMKAYEVYKYLMGPLDL